MGNVGFISSSKMSVLLGLGKNLVKVREQNISLHLSSLLLNFWQNINWHSWAIPKGNAYPIAFSEFTMFSFVRDPEL